jgi:hypothetical protein
MDVKKLKSIEPFTPNPDKNSIYCIACGNKATNIAHFSINGAVILEKYCDVCVNEVRDKYGLK